jgi:predicted transcriptional regulator
MFAAHKAGESVEELAAEHGLTETRVRVILREERNMHLVSSDDFYRDLRRSAWHTLAMR